MIKIFYYKDIDDEDPEAPVTHERWIRFDQILEMEATYVSDKEPQIYLDIHTVTGHHHQLEFCEENRKILDDWRDYVLAENGSIMLIDGQRYNTGIDFGKEPGIAQQSTRGAAENAACNPESADSSEAVESGSGEDVPDGHPGLGKA